MIKMICVDIDGTILRNGKIHPTTLKAIKHAQSLDIPVVIATGRNVHTIRFIAKKLKLYGCGYHFISQNGAQLFQFLENGDVEVEYTKAFTKTQAKEIFDVAKKNKIKIYAYSEDEHFAYTTNRLGIISFVLKFRHRPQHVLNIKSIDKRPNITKCLCFGNMKNMNNFKETLKQHNYSTFGFSYVSDARSNIELNQSGVNKADGLKFVCEELGIDPKDIIYFGDGSNDIGAIKFAGTGVAMANAKPEVKSVADVITELPVEKGGVGDHLFKNIFNK